MFATIWDQLSPENRQALLAQIDTRGALKDKAAIATLSGSGVLAALSTTVYFTGFAFYTTMSTTICAVAGMLNVTLPFAVYTGASSLIHFLAGPIGWALLAIATAAGVALAGRANVTKTVAAISQIHALKVAAVETAGNPSDDLFQALGNPLKRQLVGKWTRQLKDRKIDFEIKSDGTFTANDTPVANNGTKPATAQIRGNWGIRDGHLTVAVTDVWSTVKWTAKPEVLIGNVEIVKVTEALVVLKSAESLERR